MATTVAVDASPAKKPRMEEEDDEKRSMISSSSDDEEDDDYYRPPKLTEELKGLISDFNEKLLTTGDGFEVPKDSRLIMNRVDARIQPTNVVSCETNRHLTRAVNTAIRFHKEKEEKKKKNPNKKKMTGLVLQEILSATVEFSGLWLNYITFKAVDSSGAVRTYETLIDPMFRGEEPVLEVFRVKPYTPVEYVGHKVGEEAKAAGLG